MKEPRISLIIPSFNQGKYIEQTILSIIEQDYKDVELIIIDGGSTDNTLNIIKKYENQITYWESKSDDGQAHAINKGLEKATGEIFNWINSDDYLERNALRSVANSFERNPDMHVLCGLTRCFWDQDNSTSHEYRTGVKLSVTETITEVIMNQPGTFFKTKIIRDLGGVNESLRYVFDDELWFRYLCKYGIEFIGTTDDKFAEFRLHSDSKSVKEGYEYFNKEIQSLYIDIAQNINIPEWLISLMKENEYSKTYRSSGNWNMSHLEAGRFQAYFANRYINTLYCRGQKKLAKQAMNMVIQNGYFKWNRMMASLRLKLFFA